MLLKCPGAAALQSWSFSLKQPPLAAGLPLLLGGDGFEERERVEQRRRGGNPATGQLGDDLKGIRGRLAAIMVVREDVSPLRGASDLVNPLDPLLEFVLAVEVIVAGVAAGIPLAARKPTS